MSNKITIEELEKYLWESAVLLRTHVDAGAYKQYIFPLLFFKRLSDVYDEECEKVRTEYGEEALDWEENHQFQIPDGAHWNDVRNVSENVGKAIIEAFHKLKLQILKSYMVFWRCILD
ncbi:type I restriction-modification system subunit M N-terminal domain-containing protein [Holdemanella biformis]|uniref:type I restriction-modification system subunit M N-terminal domain-containing protein n=1 Tax=Holdemanella biformis TaxID=1735 RepID=UPI001C703445|nr:type I restriction-modification system subunit M N-terminal domain-containing protein [Holdemanella biformis]